MAVWFLVLLRQRRRNAEWTFAATSSTRAELAENNWVKNQGYLVLWERQGDMPKKTGKDSGAWYYLTRMVGCQTNGKGSTPLKPVEPWRKKRVDLFDKSLQRLVLSKSWWPLCQSGVDWSILPQVRWLAKSEWITINSDKARTLGW